LNRYAAYNALLAVTVLLASVIWFRRNGIAGTRRAAKVALAVMLIGLPWDYFAIKQGIWRYPVEPGPLLHGVPVNDLVFIWLCSYLASTVLIWLGMSSGSESHAHREYTREQDARQD
jgi:lycopene cyclase domain-containing protein